MPKLMQASLWSFGLTKTLAFSRPFLAMPKLMQASLWSFGLTKTLAFSRPFLAMPKLMQASLWSFGLTKTLTFYCFSSGHPSVWTMAADTMVKRILFFISSGAFPI
jgi:hypothetical protein